MPKRRALSDKGLTDWHVLSVLLVFSCFASRVFPKTSKTFWKSSRTFSENSCMFSGVPIWQLVVGVWFRRRLQFLFSSSKKIFFSLLYFSFLYYVKRWYWKSVDYDDIVEWSSRDCFMVVAWLSHDCVVLWLYFSCDIILFQCYLI